MDDRRFEAACAAMQGILANPDFPGTKEEAIAEAWSHADALLAELDLTAPDTEPAPTTDAARELALANSVIDLWNSVYGNRDGASLDNQMTIRMFMPIAEMAYAILSTPPAPSTEPAPPTDAARELAEAEGIVRYLAGMPDRPSLQEWETIKANAEDWYNRQPATPPAPAVESDDFNKGQNHALRIVADLLGMKVATHQNVKAAIEARVLPEGVTVEHIRWLAGIAASAYPAGTPAHKGVQRILNALTQPNATDKGEPE